MTRSTKSYFFFWGGGKRWKKILRKHKNGGQPFRKPSQIILQVEDQKN